MIVMLFFLIGYFLQPYKNAENSLKTEIQPFILLFRERDPCHQVMHSNLQRGGN